MFTYIPHHPRTQVLISWSMIVTVASFKGGVGKTTTAVHLAALLAEKGETLLIDDDPNRSATAWAEPGRLPFRVILESERHGVQTEYEHLVIDTPARADPADIRALAKASDLLVLPTTPEALALTALLQIARMLEESRDRVRVLLTICPPYPERDAEEAKEMLGGEDLRVLKAQIRRAKAFQKAALAGGLVHEVSDPRARVAWLDYVSAGRELGL